MPPPHIIAPFRGLRYSTSRSRDLSSVIAPPYDVISPELQQSLYARDEHNFVRVELPVDLDTDTEADNRYTRAAATLREWLADGVMRRDETPSFYVVESEFSLGGDTYRRRGVFAAVRLPEPNERYVLAHEATFSAPRADRFRLMSATHAMISPVMAMYEDPQRDLLRLLQGLTGPPTAEATDHEGAIHRLWAVPQGAMTDALRAAVGSGPLYIADGHHRFETARAYREEMRRAYPDAPADAAFDYGLMLLVSAADPALKVLPTHRVVSNLGLEGAAWAESRMRDSFETRPRSAPEWTHVEDLLRAESRDDDNVYAVYSADGTFAVLTARREVRPVTDSPVDKLDVTVLHDLLLDPMLEREPTPPVISYVVDPQEAADRVARGEGDFAFFLRGTRLDQIIAVARAGEHMPKKSTYFHPKAIAGLVISDASAETL